MLKVAAASVFKSHRNNIINRKVNMDFETVFEKLARFDNRHRFCVMVFMLATTAMLALGLLNIRLETDPQSLWVSHDSQGYKEEMYFNDNFGAFFRTEQIMMVQVPPMQYHRLTTETATFWTMTTRSTCMRSTSSNR